MIHKTNSALLQGNTAATLAALHGKVAALEVLHELGGDLNYQDHKVCAVPNS
jgi:hypothetical protein